MAGTGWAPTEGAARPGHGSIRLQKRRRPLWSEGRGGPDALRRRDACGKVTVPLGGGQTLQAVPGRGQAKACVRQEA